MPPALPLAALLLFHSLSAAEGPCRLPAGAPRAPIVGLPSVDAELRIPKSWSAVITEHSGIVRIRNEAEGGCWLVLTRHRGNDTAARLRRVHEALYLDRSLLEETCGAARLGSASQRRDVLFGEYERDGRSRVYGMFWTTGTVGYTALLTCPRGGPGDWRAALPLLTSIRRTGP